MLANVKTLLCAALLSLSFNSSAISPEAMIDQILNTGDNLVQDGNVVKFTFHGIPLMLVFDVNADRMRLVSPIAEMKDVSEDMLLMAMEANFHSALDARYAVSNEVVWSAFIHPLEDLSPELLDSAINQVAVAHATFGTDFTSGALIFPNQSQ